MLQLAQNLSLNKKKTKSSGMGKLYNHCFKFAMRDDLKPQEIYIYME